MRPVTDGLPDMGTQSSCC